MVPLRVISEGLGAGVAWNQQSKTVTITDEDTVITMTNGASAALVNGSTVALSASVQARSGRMMVPLRFICEQLGLTVVWNQADKTIALQSGDGGGTAGGLRGAWVSTVYNLDWPTASSYDKEEQQKQEFLQLLDELKVMGMTAVFVQVRPAGDALYPSNLVPWSKYLTGVQGEDPGYDPLAFMIDEAHKRDMEFHAWCNPFRASVDAKTDALAENHIAVEHPEWIVNANNKLYINPGIPEARQHIIDVIMEVVNGYEIDGVHLDDYFYPAGAAFADDSAFDAYNTGGFTDKADWRRDNINAFVRQLDTSIHAAKPEIRFGISPFGVWRNKSVDATGSDTKASVTAYDNMYADVRTWIKQGWIDYAAPQIYWSFANTLAPYGKLTEWWVEEVRGTGVDLYIGHSPYKLGTKEAGWHTADEITAQLRYNEQFAEIKGDLFFSAKDLRRNPLGLIELLKKHYGTSV
jgi:uncharacterized lipoprotein YddW (UPF0748 family)